MRAEYKYLGVGFAGGIGIAALFIGAMAFGENGFALAPSTPAWTPVPISPAEPARTPISENTIIPTALATFTAEPTIVLSPTPTLTGVETLRLSGEMITVGALPEKQQSLLYISSLQYIADTPESARLMAQKINGVEYGYADNTCGPLAISILRDAGLVELTIVPHNFWLLNPWVEDDRAYLDRTLPPDKFKHYVFPEWMKSFDWKKFPLLPGDFLYIHAGGGGNFDHMLVVNRVDSQLRAYSVTNYRQPDGFVIDEAMLYDPNDAQAGILYTWSARAKAPYGSTGFGGFELWRPIAPGN